MHRNRIVHWSHDLSRFSATSLPQTRKIIWNPMVWKCDATQSKSRNSSFNEHDNNSCACWVGQEDREEVCTRPEYRRKESRESVTYFNLKMQLSRNGCRDCLFAYQGGGYKKKKKEKRIRNSHGENELRKEWYWLWISNVNRIVTLRTTYWETFKWSQWISDWMNHITLRAMLLMK